ncbi:MAG: hypothetical protein WCT99_11380 [Bacteroidota bacterium]|jgi:K+-sensing histidine kinase KdpD
MHTETARSTFNSPVEYFASVIQRPRQGSIKLYVGRVPAGDLFKVIVHEGKQLTALGIDVVVAADDKRSAINFPSSKIIPPKEIQGTKFTEMDYGEIQRRLPDVVVVDDLLHLNLDTQQAERRYHNIKTFLSLGISVIASVYSSWDENLKSILRHFGSGNPVPVEKWASLPHDELVALVFTPKETFSHAELLELN